MDFSDRYTPNGRDKHNEEFLKLIMPLRGFEPRMSSFPNKIHETRVFPG